jgi:glycosyltransferase involved in cell wall biosynthesis
MATEIAIPGDARVAHRRPEQTTDEYVVVHLVSDHDAFMDLIDSQVVDHMVRQAGTDGPDRPARVIVGVLQPVRIARSRRMHVRMEQLQARGPSVSVVLLPYVEGALSRLSVWALTLRLRRLIRARRVVFHCRGERAVLWARELAPRCGGGVVADIRGAWSEEVLNERGYDGPEGADAPSLRLYHGALSRLHAALAVAGPVISVSDGMLQWLRQRGVHDDRLVYVPCCVDRIAFSAEARARRRGELDIVDKLVFAYAGTIASYQHIEDGMVPFFRAAALTSSRAHLLCITNDVEKMKVLLREADVPETQVSVLSVKQRDVAEYLCAADCGLLVRGPTRLTRLTLPVKFAEYLASGLPVIVSRIGGWLDEVVARHGVGVAIDCFNVDERTLRAEALRVCNELEARSHQMRRAALEMCQREFLWDRYVPAVRQAYRSALARAAIA